jgi:polyisoprenoid-binding protein YceI
MTKWLVGIIPAAIAAIVAALVSLPLKSPDDAILNSGTVTIGALMAGLAIGGAWVAFGARPAVYAGIVAAAFAAALAIAGVFEAQLSGSFKYMVPLEVIVFAIVGVLTPFTARLLAEPRLQLGGSAAGLVAALALGLALAGQGDSESGHLSFPETKNTPVATAVETTAPGETPSTPSSSGSTVTTADVQGVTYIVVPDESKLTYTVVEKLAVLPNESEAVGSTGSLSGEVHLDGQPSTVSVDMSTLTSNQDRRDGYVRDRIFNADPTVTFVVDNLSGLPTSYQPGDTVSLTVVGTATVRGVSKPITFAVDGKFDGDELQLLGTTDFTWADFNIDPPNIQNIVQVHENVHIEVLIIARPSQLNAGLRRARRRRRSGSGARARAAGLCDLCGLGCLDARQERRDQVDRHREHDRAVLLRRNLRQRLEHAQLQRPGLTRDHPAGL